jgi:hypothetical protein
VCVEPDLNQNLAFQQLLDQIISFCICCSLDIINEDALHIKSFCDPLKSG